VYYSSRCKIEVKEKVAVLVVVNEPLLTFWKQYSPMRIKIKNGTDAK
jgi:hypothetical protein